MEFGQDSEPNADVRFIANHIPVFNPEECSFPNGTCSLVATASKFGRIFVACGTQIKVFDSKTVWDDPASSLLTTLSVGAQVTHVAVSCDGLTLLATVLYEQAPHALFYEIRGLVPGCGQQTPLLSMGLAGAGSQVHTLAWNPTDPGSVAVALSPSSLILLTLKENKVESKSENIEARALGWSPKGKQLTVGLEDGTLKLFKPDLTAVRNIQRPPMAEVSAVLSVTWFNNTEFFIGYKSSVEEGAHVIMYVNAPKAKEPRFVAYEFVCNYNQGPRPPLFYPHYFPEWSLLCVMSSRAVAMAVLGRPGGSTEGWCEYEIDEGCIAAVHNVSITEETFPLGLAVDFTSQKTFTAKDHKVSGPCPVLYTLSTGGELNLFHIVNEKPGAEALTKLPESLPATGLRTAQQFGRLASYPMNKAAPSSAPSTFSAPQTALPAPQTPMAPSPSPASQQKADTMSFNPPAQAASPFSASPLQTLSANFKPPQTQSSPITTSLFPKSEPAPSASFFNVQVQNEGTKTTPAFPATTFKPPQIITTSQDFKFPNCPLPQPSTPAMSVNPVAKADTKPPPAIITAVTPKATDTKPQGVGPPARPPLAVVAELDETLLSTIEAARVDFERELEDHKSMGDLPNQIGEQEEMGRLRCSLGEAAEWVDQMNSTTSELKGEVGQLHSEVLEGFTLSEEAETQVNKIKNPRHCQALQPQTLDPHSRKQMEEIRSRYQYLQSQLSEIDTRLHLDWAAYRNEQNKKKKKELPASETLYQALKKCHFARKVCERRVDSLCERIKDLHLHSLSGLTTSQTNQDDDEILDNLEKSLRETSISAPSCMSPFKMLSPRKQESLQKALLQRNFIPLRKCSRSPRLNMSSLENLSPGHTPQASHHSSYSASAGHSLMESFGPQTFSTPVRNNINATKTKGTSEASMTQTSDAISGAAAPKPQYEDITPPQTPDNRLTQSAKPTSPLRALSRLVSEVPTTTGTSDTKTPGITVLPEGKTAFRGFGDGGSTHGALKIPVTVASGPPLGAFKPVTSASSFSKTTLAFPFTQFVPPSTVVQGSAAQPSMSQSLTGSSSLLFQPPPGSSDNASFPHTSSSEISQKTEVNSGMFFSPPASISESHTQASEKSETSAVPFSKPSSHPLASCSQEQSVFESAGNTSTPGSVNAPQTFTSMPLQSSTAETDSVSSSSSADSDTASNATVIGDNTEGQEPPAERVRDMASSQGGSLRAALDGSSTQQSNAAGLKQSGSNSQPSSFLVPSGNLFGSSSGMMFGGSSSTNSGIFGAKTSIDSGKLEPSTTAVTTTSTTATVSMPAPTINSASLFMSPSTVSGGFFTGTAMTASESVVTTSTTVSSSLFGAQLTTSSSKGLLGSTTTTAATVPVPVMTSATTSSTTLGTSTTSSIFGGSKPTSGGTVFEVPTTAGGGIFGASSTTTGSVFGSGGTLSGSVFGTAGTAATTGNTIEASYANNKTSDGNLFGNTATGADTASNVPTLISAASGSSNVFGTASTPATSSIFGLSTTAVSTTGSGSIFGISTTASGSIFGGTSTSGSLFSTAATTSTGSIFKTPTSAGSEGIFGSSGGSTSGSSIFGTQAKTDATTPSIFGLAKNSTGSLFGGAVHSGTSTTSASTTISTASASTSTTTSSAPVLTMGLFSAPPAGGSPSFSLSIPSGGGSATSGASTLFSSQTTTPTTGASFSGGGIFSASSSTTSSAFTSLTTSSSAFTSPSSSGAPPLTPGTIAAATTSSSVFGQGSQSTSGSVFGGAPSPQGPHFDGGGQGSGGFGTSALGGSIFGGSAGQSLFGNTSSSSIFGQTSAANTPSPFSSVSTSKAESSPFGGSSVFGSGGGGGGGFFSGLGSKPNAESANKNVFGTTSLSNAAPQTSLFGNNNSSSPFQSSIFGGSSTAGNGGSGSFSGGSGPVANTGFAVTSPQTPQGFGGAATFGGSPSFGGGPTFGSPPRIASQSPVFGGSSTFSSPLSSSTGPTAPTAPTGGGFSVFASSGGATFGSIAGSSGSGTSSGFGGFANQTNTPTFGSVAQQSNNQSSGDAFGAATGTTFGSGSSFSSWR